MTIVEVPRTNELVVEFDPRQKFRCKVRAEVLAWLDARDKSRLSWDYSLAREKVVRFFFMEPNDALLFKLTWGGS